MYIPRLPAGPIVASLASMAQASTLKKCKAADQSGLERQRTQRPQCESLSLFFFFFFLPQSPLLALLSCSQRAVVKETGVWSHLTETRTARTYPRALWDCSKLSVDLWLHSAVWPTCLSEYSRPHWRPGLNWCFDRQIGETSVIPLPPSLTMPSQNTELLAQCLTFHVYQDLFSE